MQTSLRILSLTNAGVTVNPGNFVRILFSQLALKDIVKTGKISRLGYDLPISVVDRVISPFCEDFYFHETTHIKPSRKFPN